MANNIFQQQITPIKPKVLESERIYVYVPTATKTTKGTASFNERDFGVNNGHVSLIWSEQLLVEQLSNPLNQVSSIKVLADEFINTNNIASITNPITGVTYNSNTAEVMLNRRNRDAFVRPDFVMLDNTKDFESSTDENGFVKYTLKRNNPLEQPSLIQVSAEDFVRENGIVKINWTDIEKAVSDLDTKLQSDIDDIEKAVSDLDTKLQSDIDDIVNNTTKIGDANNSFATKGGTIAAGINNAIQLGQGENTEAGTFKFRSYTIIDKDGKVYTNTGNASAIEMKLVATEDFVKDLISKFSNGVTLIFVDALPTENINSNAIYFVKVENPSGNNYYEEYAYVENRWELIGTTQINLENYYDKETIDNLLLTTHKQIVLGADGVLEENVYNFTVESPDSYLDYRTNGTKFLVDLHLPIVGELDTTKEVAITFGDTVYFVYNILKGQEHSTIGDLRQVDKYNNQTGYRFITEMTFFENADITGFAIIPTISMSDVLALNSDEMDNYVTDGGLTQGQLAICSKVITNGYNEGSLYRFDITYPDTYQWTEISGGNPLIKVVGAVAAQAEVQGIAIGTGTQAYGNQSIAIGVDAKTKTLESGSIAIGRYAETEKGFNIAIGTSARTKGLGDIAIGTNSKINSQLGIAIGYNAGTDNYLLAESTITIGKNAKSHAGGAIQIGEGLNETKNTAQFGGSYQVINSLSIYQDADHAKDGVAGYKKVLLEGEISGGTITNVNDTITVENFDGFVNLSDEQYSELVQNGSITIDGQTLTYNDNTVYVTPDISTPNSLTFSGTNILTSEQTFTSHVQILVEFETDSIHAGFDCVLHPYDEAVCFVTFDVLVNGTPNFGTAYLDETGHVVINVPNGLTFNNIHGKYIVYGG